MPTLQLHSKAGGRRRRRGEEERIKGGSYKVNWFIEEVVL